MPKPSDIKNRGVVYRFDQTPDFPEGMNLSRKELIGEVHQDIIIVVRFVLTVISLLPIITIRILSNIFN